MFARKFAVLERRLKSSIRAIGGAGDQPYHASNTQVLQCNAHNLGEFVVRSLIPIVGTNPFPPHELMLMAAAVSWLQPKMILEWGTNVGVSARVFHDTTRALGIQCEIHSVDLEDDASHAEHPGRRRGVLVRGLDVHLHQGNGAEAAAAIASAKRCVAPLVFVDGDHAYESVLLDARTIVSAAPDASLLFHDTFAQPGTSDNDGPARVVSELMNLRPGRYRRIDSLIGKPGMTLLTPSGRAHE